MRRATTAPPPPPMARPTIDQQPAQKPEGGATGSVVSDGDAHADHAVEVALAAGRRGGQAAQREDEQDAGDEIEKGRDIGGHRAQPFFLYMASMRWVTRKPPKMFTLARIRAMKPKHARPERTIVAERAASTPTDEQRADHDHRGDRVGDRHQRRVQRRRHRPDHVVADEDGQHEDGEAEHEGVDRAAGRRRAPPRPRRVGELVGIALRRIGGILARSLCGGLGLVKELVAGVSIRHGVVLPVSAAGSAIFGWKFGCTTAPSRVRFVALTSSSSHFTASAFAALSIMVSRKAKRFLA